MPDTIRWGLLSTARINDALIGPIQKSPRSELYGVASRDRDKAQSYALEKKIEHAYDSYEDMLADPAIDAVYISLPNSLHCEWAVKAAEAGKHILCEKPMAVTLDEFDRMAAAAAASNVTLFEAFMYLHHPQTLHAQQLIREGKLGAVQSVQSWFHFYLPPERSTNIRLNAGLSGGSLWDVGVYPNSLAITMIGQGAPNSVWASQIVGESGVDVAMRGQLLFDNNVVAQISSGFRTPFREGAFIVGDAGILHIPEPWKPGLTGRDSVMTLTHRDGSVESITTPAIDPYLCEVQAMEACILDGAAPVISLAQSREFLRSVLAHYESAASGQIIKL
ncbi:MAG: Gfo/Idh/MocA family oxidoreductase [Caldilineaceae bacterium]|nr:Gfo/Idh/MocA family oxidoreductase [Caldilineaceae bacterium]